MKLFNQLSRSLGDKVAGGAGGGTGRSLLPQINAAADNEALLWAHGTEQRRVSPHLTLCAALSAAAESDALMGNHRVEMELDVFINTG